MDQTAQLCSHRLHSAATFERRSHCPVAPAVPLLVVIGTVDSGQYIFRNAKMQMNRKERERKKERGVRARHDRQKADELTSRYFAR